MVIKLYTGVVRQQYNNKEIVLQLRRILTVGSIDLVGSQHACFVYPLPYVYAQYDAVCICL